MQHQRSRDPPSYTSSIYLYLLYVNINLAQNHFSTILSIGSRPSWAGANRTY